MEKAYSYFRSQVSKAIDKSSKTRNMRRNKNIYMNCRAMQLKKRKQVLWGIHCRTHDPIDHARFARGRNVLRKLTRKLRSNYESRLASDLKQNQKHFGDTPVPDFAREVA